MLWQSMKAYASLCNLIVVLALLSQSELMHFKPDFQEQIFGGFVPLCIHIQSHGPRQVSLVGITTRRAEP